MNLRKGASIKGACIKGVRKKLMDKVTIPPVSDDDWAEVGKCLVALQPPKSAVATVVVPTAAVAAGPHRHYPQLPATIGATG